MQETIEQFKVFFRSFWENRWLALTTAVVLSIIGWVAVITMADRYEVTTRVYVDTRSMLKPLLKGIAVDSSVTQSTAEIMKRTLLSRPNLELVARKTGLDTEIGSPQAYDKMIEKLAQKILISGGREVDNIYTISYAHRDPIMAKNVSQLLLDLFIEKVIGANRLDTDEAKKYLDEKIAEYVVRLTDAENRLKEFKKEHPGVLVNDDNSYFARLEIIKKELQTAQLDLQEQEHRRSALNRQLKVTPRFVGGGGGTRRLTEKQNPIDLRILRTRAELEGLLLKYSDQHPDVSSTRRRLQNLQEQKKAGVTGDFIGAAAETEIITAPVSLPNPAYQTLKLAHSEADAMVAALGTRVGEYQKRLLEMEANVDTLPDIEARLTSLNRAYVVNKSEYEELLKRRGSADISEGANNVDELKLKVIDPARVPLAAAGPNRLKWLTVVFLLALGAGAGVGILLSMMRPKIYDKHSIKQLTTLPVLGNVSKLNTVSNHLAKGAGNITYSLAAGVLLLAYSGLMLAYLFNVDFVHDYAGFGIEQMEEQIGSDVISPIKDVLEEI